MPPSHLHDTKATSGKEHHEVNFIAGSRDWESWSCCSSQLSDGASPEWPLWMSSTTYIASKYDDITMYMCHFQAINTTSMWKHLLTVHKTTMVMVHCMFVMWTAVRCASKTWPIRNATFSLVMIRSCSMMRVSVAAARVSSNHSQAQRDHSVDGVQTSSKAEF